MNKDPRLFSLLSTPQLKCHSLQGIPPDSPHNSDVGKTRVFGIAPVQSSLALNINENLKVI